MAYVTALGVDPVSERVRVHAVAEGLDAALIARVPDRPVGLYAIATDDLGERRFTYWRDGSAARTLFSPGSSVALADLDGFDLLYLTGITLAILPDAVRGALVGHLREFRDRGGLVAFDGNYRPALWSSRRAARDAIGALWSLADIALPSLDDEMALFGDPDEDAVIDRLRRSGIRAGALKRGARGPRSLATGEAVANPPAATAVVDTTAAGDSFGAGYLSAWLHGRTDADAMAFGHRVATHVIGRRGAIVPLPTDLMRAVREGPQGS